MEHQYFVIVLLALMLCQEPRTLSGLSCFLSQSPGRAETLTGAWWDCFRGQMRPLLAAYIFLDDERGRLTQARQQHVTMDETRQDVQRLHRRHLIDWMHHRFRSGATPQQMYELLAVCGCQQKLQR